ncbi:hypothetical protein ACFYTQ_33295 [Nocardia sp. NPDC004068]|uniref:hypothetical protein n=1 Tax=Nocardia sp. NPDC004068 TaxID=3364303 RepID=UPI003698E55D
MSDRVVALAVQRNYWPTMLRELSGGGYQCATMDLSFRHPGQAENGIMGELKNEINRIRAAEAERAAQAEARVAKLAEFVTLMRDNKIPTEPVVLSESHLMEKRTLLLGTRSVTVTTYSLLGRGWMIWQKPILWDSVDSFEVFAVPGVGIVNARREEIPRAHMSSDSRYVGSTGDGDVQVTWDSSLKGFALAGRVAVAKGSRSSILPGARQRFDSGDFADGQLAEIALWNLRNK